MSASARSMPRRCCARGALGGERCGLDLNRKAKFHHADDVGDGGQPVRIDPERHPRAIGCDERAGALAGDDEAVRLQRGDRLAHHGAADAHRAHHFLLGRQPRAGLQPAARNLVGNAVDHLRCAVANRAAAASATRPCQRFGLAASFSGCTVIVQISYHRDCHQHKVSTTRDYTGETGCNKHRWRTTVGPS